MRTISARIVTGLAVVGLLGQPAGHAWAEPLPHPAQPPVPGAVTRKYDAPVHDWLPGHRGVDLRAAPGSPVRSAAAGVVTFAGVLAGRGVVVVSHGEVRTTYEPVTGSVPRGTTVRAGDVLGSLDAGHPGCPEGCLHWGLRRGEQYLDPMSLLSRPEVRLVGRTYAAALPFAAGAGGGGDFSLPPGPVTSEFGMRRHPVLGTWSLHDGVDLGLACDTPIRAVGPGVVTWAGPLGGLGLAVEIDHGAVGGKHLVTRYGHASSLSVQGGQHVTGGAELARVGSTGWSTGCHLHLTTVVDGAAADPRRVLR